ncbi:MAG TPA: hypothetical protein VIG06_02690 [Kofleriaceae bacterium]
MKRAVLAVPFFLFLLVGLATGAHAGQKVKPVKNQKLSAYAKNRPRGAKGKFSKQPVKNLLIRGALRGTGRANPAATGSSAAHIDLVPPTRARSGNLTVKIPEMYVGSTTAPSKTRRQLFATDIRGNDVVIDGTLEVAGSRTGFAKATFHGTIPAGAKLSQGGVERALKSLQVHEAGLQWKPFVGGE